MSDAVTDALLRAALVRLGGSERLRDALVKAPGTREVVQRFVPGETQPEAMARAQELITAGLKVSVDVLGEYTRDRDQATAAAQRYIDLLRVVADEELGREIEVSLKLSAVGQSLADDGEQIARDNAQRVCQAASAAGTTVTLDMEDHTTTDSTLGILRDLRVDFPRTGAVIQAALRRSEADCRELAGPGSRVRLCKGAYSEPASVAFGDRGEVDQSYVRCLRVLMQGDGYPMVASHDPRIIKIADALASRNQRTSADFEFQMLFGIRPLEQRRLADLGRTVRVYLPFGTDWYGYFMRRLAERPANLAFFLRSIVGRR